MSCLMGYGIEESLSLELLGNRAYMGGDRSNSKVQCWYRRRAEVVVVVIFILKVVLRATLAAD